VSWLEVIVLGIVQGLTEFLPISSSGHLRIVGAVFFGHDAGSAFTAVTQIGTEIAVVVYFAKDIGRLLSVWWRGFRTPMVRVTADYKIAWFVIIGTIPIALLGVIFRDQIETVARNLWLIASTLIIFGILLGVAEIVGKQRTELKQMNLRQGVAMGFAQAMALVPGVSRSGGTITVGLFVGMKRAAVVRYSFLLAIPAVFASGLFTLPDVFAGDGPSPIQMVVATLLAGVVGYLCIAWLLRYVEKRSVFIFVWYRIALGVALIVALSLGWLAPL
jgi:undecaprenyl-diphosphatase